MGKMGYRVGVGIKERSSQEESGRTYEARGVDVSIRGVDKKPQAYGCA